MDHAVDRRQVLKLGAGAAAVAAAVAVLPKQAGAASAAAPAAVPAAVPAAGKPPIGSAGIVKLWGTTFVTKKVGKKKVRTKVLKTKGVYSGTDKPTLDKGGLCHWLGTPAPLSAGNCVLFGHRTAARGLLRNVQKIKKGDQIVLNINGVGTKTYQVVVPKTIIGSRDFAQALNWGGGDGKAHITLVACTKPNGAATSTKFRYLVRATAIN